MANDRNAGAKPKFPNVETEILHVRKIVPLGMAEIIKKEINERIKQQKNRNYENVH